MPLITLDCRLSTRYTQATLLQAGVRTSMMIVLSGGVLAKPSSMRKKLATARRTRSA
jgi:hypothetical protein